MMAYIKLMTSMALWGSIGLFILWSDLDGITIAFFRCVFGALVFFLLTKMTWKDITSYSFKEYALIITSSLFLIMNWLFLFKSFQLASITLGNIAYYTQPVFLVLLGIVLFKENVSVKQFTFILLIFIGLCFTLNLDIHELNWGNKTFLGVGYALLAGFFYALATVIIKKLQHIPTRHLTAMQLLLGALLLLPFMHSFQMKMWQWSYVILIGVVHTALAYQFFYDAMKSLSIIVVAVFSYLDPIIAVLTDIIFFERTLTIMQLFGIVITLWASYKIINER